MKLRASSLYILFVIFMAGKKPLHALPPTSDIASELPKNSPSTNELYNSLPIAIYTCNTLGHITGYNHAAAALWGKSPAIGTDVWSESWKVFKPNGALLPPEKYPIMRALRENVIATEEIILQRPDGSRINILPHPALSFDAEGNVTGAINTLIDITEQRKGEAKQAMLAAIIESSEDAIIGQTLEGVITSWNKAAEKMFGYHESAITGKPITTLVPEHRLEEEKTILKKIQTGENVDHYETVRLTNTGEEISVSLTISPIKNLKGEVTGVSKIVRDISRKKSYEDQLRHSSENLKTLNSIGKLVSESLDVTDILQKVTDVTTSLTGAAYGAFFYNKTDENGKSYTLYTLSGAPREAFDKFGMVRNTSVFHPTFSGEGVVRVADITKDPRYGQNPPHNGMPKGHLPVVSYLAVPVISKSGIVIGGLFYGHPEPGKFSEEHEEMVVSIASQAAIALDNAKLYEEIHKLNAKKDEFIGLAGHELNTPMTSLSGYLQIINKGLKQEDPNKSFIQKALQQVNKLSCLISDLLDVSKIESGKLPLSFTTFDLYLLAEEVIELTQYSTKSHKIAFTSGHTTLMVYADKQRIEQVIINLISNAIKYSPKGNLVNVAVSAAKGKALLSVQDYGFGINKDQMEWIFSRFYRIEGPGYDISGLGIGLYISQEIISRHNGKFHVSSEVGVGSVFQFEIPIEQTELS